MTATPESRWTSLRRLAARLGLALIKAGDRWTVLDAVHGGPPIALDLDEDEVRRFVQASAGKICARTDIVPFQQSIGLRPFIWQWRPCQQLHLKPPRNKSRDILAVAVLRTSVCRIKMGRSQP